MTELINIGVLPNFHQLSKQKSQKLIKRTSMLQPKAAIQKQESKLRSIKLLLDKNEQSYKKGLITENQYLQTVNEQLLLKRQVLVDLPRTMIKQESISAITELSKAISAAESEPLTAVPNSGTQPSTARLVKKHPSRKVSQTSFKVPGRKTTTLSRVSSVFSSKETTPAMRPIRR
jgi:hypothetical protein